MGELGKLLPGMKAAAHEEVDMVSVCGEWHRDLSRSMTEFIAGDVRMNRRAILANRFQDDLLVFLRSSATAVEEIVL